MSIDDILDGARHAASVVDEISRTIREQSRASDEIARRVELIAQRPQQNTQAPERGLGDHALVGGAFQDLTGAG